VLVSFFLVFYPNIVIAKDVSRLETGPDQHWHEALLWLRQNSPEPFGDPAYFNRFFEPPVDGQNYSYPESAYGVISAWDYGHWITAIAHRIPVSNPHQYGAGTTSRFMIAQSEKEGNKFVQQSGCRYVMIDLEMVTRSFSSFSAWVGSSPSIFGETLYQADQAGDVRPIMVYYPEYYRSMCIRLYNFDGLEVSPADSIKVISWENRVDIYGHPYKLINFSKQFTSYTEAEAYCQSNPQCKIIGLDPFISPVPLEKLEHYRLVHSSGAISNQKTGQHSGYVEIFEYQP